MKNSAINAISGDPLSWIDPSRLPVFSSTYGEVQKGILNKMLNRRFSLLPLDERILKDVHVRYTCENWFYLRQTAFYMACYRHRSSVMQSPYVYTLGSDVRAFMDMNKSCAGGIQHLSFGRLDLMQSAYAEIAGLTETMPQVLSKRTVLLFPESEHNQQVHVFDNILFTMALNHAKNYCA